MTKVGDIVETTVVEIHPFGMYVDADGVRGLILIPEITWGRISSPADHYSVGDRFKCKVLRRPGDGTAHFIGSIKQVHPDDDPWRDPSVYAVGTTFHGRMTMQTSYGVFVEHHRGPLVLLHADDLGHDLRAYGVGTVVTVEITEVNAPARKIRGRPLDA